MVRVALFLFIALLAAAEDGAKTYNYTGKPLKVEVSRTGITNFVFDEEIEAPVTRKEQNLEFDIKGKHVYFRFQPKIKYQIIGDKKVEVDRTIEAVRNHFYLVGKSGKHYEMFVTPVEGYGETIYIHDTQIEKDQMTAFETKDPRNHTIVNLAKSVLKNETIPGYKVQEINELSGKEKNFNTYLKKRYVGNLYIVEVFEIEVLSDTYIPDEYNFKKFPTENKVFISVYDWEKPLKKGETTEIVIVGYKQ